MIGSLDFGELMILMRGRAMADAPCPLCGPQRRNPLKRSRPVLRIWDLQPGFVSFHCVRCGEYGYAREDETRPIDHEAIRRAREERAAREKEMIQAQLLKARALWNRRRPIGGTIAEKYLREARGITCRLPSTLGFLAARGDYPPAMIAAFGMADEPEPGVLALAKAAVRGVHLTRLLPDGSGKVPDDNAKIMVGRGSNGSPICLAPPNDLLGLLVAEGIEDALSGHQATGLGAWAAGSASRLPALAAAVPDYIDCVTVIVDDDEEGRRHAATLIERLNARGIYAEAAV